MAKLLYGVTMSLDGFIAGPGGDMQWMKPYLGPIPEVDELIKEIGSLLVGKRTATGDDPLKGQEGEGKAFGGGWEGREFVVTHHIPATARPGTTYVDDLGRAIALAKEAAGDKYVNVLGASIARQCLEVGELDEVLTFIAPVLLGDGVRLFDYPGGRNVKLERISVNQVPMATSLRYRVL
jgi:dihydrofolate reductase